MPVKCMARKGKNVVEREQEFTRFENEEIEKRFKKSFANRSLCLEKGFHLKKAEMPEFVSSVIKVHKWKVLCEHMNEAIMPLVGEFYASLTGKFQNVVHVRGKPVDITRDAINEFLGLSGSEDEHSKFLADVDREALDTVLTDLTITGTEWTRSPQGSLTVLHCRLHPKAKVWYHFIKFSLKPTTHGQTVSWERMALLHSIIVGRKIDVGSIIREEILACAQRDRSALIFPCLITRLCKSANVQIQEFDDWIPNKGPILLRTINRLMQDQGNEGAEQEQAKEEAPSSEPSPTANFSLAQLELRVSQVECAQYDIMESLQEMKRDQKEMWHYMHARDQALQKNLRMNSKKFFSFPAFPEHLYRSQDEGPSGGSK